MDDRAGAATIQIADRSHEPYYIMPRAAAQDDNLTYEAGGLLVYLLSKPDGWVVRIRDLMRVGTKRQIGRNKVYRILNELKDHGYIVQSQYRESDGKWTTSPYLVYSTPQPPCPRFRDTVKGEVLYSTES